MADKGVQIYPVIKPTTKALLDAFCVERKCSKGEAVEAALEAFLAPGAEDQQALLFQKVNNLEQGMGEVVGLLTQIVTQLEAQAKPPAVPQATYAQLYPALVPQAPVADEVQAADVLPVLPPPRWWQRVFTREVPG